MLLLVPGNPRLVSLEVPTDFNRDDVLAGCIESWLEDTHAAVRVRDVPTFSSTFVYGDLVKAKYENERWIVEEMLQPSRWNAFLAQIKSDDEIGQIRDHFAAYPLEASLVAKILPSPQGPFLALAVAKEAAEQTAADLDRLVDEGLLKDATWSIER